MAIWLALNTLSLSLALVLSRFSITRRPRSWIASRDTASSRRLCKIFGSFPFPSFCRLDSVKTFWKISFNFLKRDSNKGYGYARPPHFSRSNIFAYQAPFLASILLLDMCHSSKHSIDMEISYWWDFEHCVPNWSSWAELRPCGFLFKQDFSEHMFAPRIRGHFCLSSRLCSSNCEKLRSLWRSLNTSFSSCFFLCRTL